MTAQPGNLSPDTRRQRLVAELNARGECSVEYLVDRFGVSGMTIRRDLQELADAGKVLRTHGGAAPASRVSFEFRFLERAKLNSAAKQSIARRAASLVRDGQSVLLDSGSTTLAVARELRQRSRLTVITTSLPIASELFGHENIELILLGGLLRHDSPDLTGALTEANLENLRADVAFIGADGIDDAGRVYNASAALARMLTKMSAAATRTFVVADHSKLDRAALMRIADLKELAGLITDPAADRKFLRRLKQAGANIITADQQEHS